MLMLALCEFMWRNTLITTRCGGEHHKLKPFSCTCICIPPLTFVATAGEKTPPGSITFLKHHSLGDSEGNCVSGSLRSNIIFHCWIRRLSWGDVCTGRWRISHDCVTKSTFIWGERMRMDQKKKKKKKERHWWGHLHLITVAYSRSKLHKMAFEDRQITPQMFNVAYLDWVSSSLYTSCFLNHHPTNCLSAEIDRVQKGQVEKYKAVHHDRPIKITEKILIPVKEFPKVCI